MEDIFRELLNRNGIDPILILVDTTFNLSDECYATIVTFRDTEFVNKPVIPLQIYLHEKKDGDAHDHGMDTYFLDDFIDIFKNVFDGPSIW